VDWIGARRSPRRRGVVLGVGQYIPALKPSVEWGIQRQRGRSERQSSDETDSGQSPTGGLETHRGPLPVVNSVSGGQSKFSRGEHLTTADRARIPSSRVLALGIERFGEAGTFQVCASQGPNVSGDRLFHVLRLQGVADGESECEQL